jgi:hypothetical protein
MKAPRRRQEEQRAAVGQEHRGRVIFIKVPSETYYYLVPALLVQHVRSREGPVEVRTQELPVSCAHPTNPRARACAQLSAGTTRRTEAVLAREVPRPERGPRINPGQRDLRTRDQFQAIQGPLRVCRPPVIRRVTSSSSGRQYNLLSGGRVVDLAAPNGPWAIETRFFFPPEIYKIPPSSSSYNVTLRRRGGDDADNPPTGYTPGYMGSSIGIRLRDVGRRLHTTALLTAGPITRGRVYFFYGGGACTTAHRSVWALQSELRSGRRQ